MFMKFAKITILLHFSFFISVNTFAQDSCQEALTQALRLIEKNAPSTAELKLLTEKTYEKLIDPELGFTREQIDKNLSRLGMNMESFLSYHFHKNPGELENYSSEMVRYMTHLYAEEKGLNKDRFFRKANKLLGNPNFHKTLITMVSIELINTAFWHIILDFLPYMAEHGATAGASLAFSDLGHYIIANTVTFTIAEVFLISASASKATAKLIGMNKAIEQVEVLNKSRSSRMASSFGWLGNQMSDSARSMMPIGFVAGTVGMLGGLTLQNTFDNENTNIDYKEMTLNSLWNGLITSGFMTLSSSPRYKFIFYLKEVMRNHNIVRRDKIFNKLVYGNLLIGASSYVVYQQFIDRAKSFFGFSTDHEEKNPLNKVTEAEINFIVQSISRSISEELDPEE